MAPRPVSSGISEGEEEVLYNVDTGEVDPNCIYADDKLEYLNTHSPPEMIAAPQPSCSTTPGWFQYIFGCIRQQ